MQMLLLSDEISPALQQKATNHNGMRDHFHQSSVLAYRLINIPKYIKVSSVLNVFCESFMSAAHMMWDKLHTVYLFISNLY